MMQVRTPSGADYAFWREETSTAEHYRGLLNDRPSLMWQDVVAKALEGKDRSRTTLAATRAAIRTIRTAHSHAVGTRGVLVLHADHGLDESAACSACVQHVQVHV